MSDVVTFPGYKFHLGKSYYRDEEPGEGGYVYAEPGMYDNVAVLDVTSQHPTSIIQLNLFGNEYTPKFKDLLDARLAIKRGQYEEARKMLDGRLAPYLTDESSAKELSYALKIVINIVYGLTSAKFANPFKDPRNVDNIVAKRGALFMIDLKHLVQEMGYQVVHIKTDSIKIPGADAKIIRVVEEFGKRYGYEFEHESTYEKFCLVNDAVYIAKERQDDGSIHWEAVGKQFQQPYVYKKLFSGEDITFADLREAKSVNKGAMYLDRHQRTDKDDEKKIGEMRHIGKTGLFVPVAEGGGVLYRVFEDKFYAVAGTKGYEWMEADVAESVDESRFEIDYGYFNDLADKAREQIEKFGSFDEFVKT